MKQQCSAGRSTESVVCTVQGSQVQSVHYAGLQKQVDVSQQLSENTETELERASLAITADRSTGSQVSRSVLVSPSVPVTALHYSDVPTLSLNLHSDFRDNSSMLPNTAGLDVVSVSNDNHQRVLIQTAAVDVDVAMCPESPADISAAHSDETSVLGTDCGVVDNKQLFSDEVFGSQVSHASDIDSDSGE